MRSRLLALSTALLLLAPFSAKALTTGLPFGGYVVGSIPCTCSTGEWIYYSTLFSGTSIPITGALYFPLGAILYANYALGVPTTWELGAYAPGVSACLVLAPNPADPCIPLPALGTIEYMGTSRPGALPPRSISL